MEKRPAYQTWMERMNRIMYPLFAIITGILLLITGVSRLLPLMSDPVDAATADQSELKKNTHVSADVSMAYDYVIAVRKSAQSSDPADDSSRYYALPFVRSDDDGYRIDSFLLVKVSAKQFETYDKAAARFQAWWTDNNRDSIEYPDEILSTVDGVLQPIDEEGSRLIREYFDDTDFENCVIPYVLCPQSKTEQIIVIMISIAVIIAGTVFLFKALSKLRQEKMFRAETVVTGYYKVPADVTFDNKPKIRPEEYSGGEKS